MMTMMGIKGFFKVKTLYVLASVIGAFAYLLLASVPVAAIELDEHCTVNIMNRTVQVQDDGTWRMNNVPAFMGRVRARATCVRDGVTTSGQSEFFTLSDNDLTLVEDIFFDDPSPVPVSLSFLSADDIQLTNAQPSTSLEVIATYSDGATSPTLNATNGVNFISSNPDIVTIDNNGRLSAVSSGRALITVRLEGVVALKNVVVAMSGDVDGDGLPDSYEIANGLDPNDPVDALEDADNDGLNALEEFNEGTNIQSSDTDGDGIADGEEVVAGIDGYMTSPLIADTDGDGFSDGLEVDLATNPTDATSFDLPNAIESITITPGELKLVFNGVDTEVSDQITVQANLIDGSQKDITSSSLDTTYQSSDLTIASFGVTDGEIFGGVAGTATITASNSGYSDSITVDVERFEPVALSAIDIPGYANNVDIQGRYAYVAAGSAGLVVVDVSDRTAPHIVAQLDTHGTAVDLKVSGTTVYIADGEAGVQLIDVSDPLVPVLLSTLDTEGFAQDIHLTANYLYVADGDHGLVIINRAQQDTMFIESTLSDIGRVKGVAVDVNRAAVASTAGLILIDVSDRKSPTRISTVANRQGRDVLIRGDYVYLSAYSAGYRVVDISDMTNPVVVAGDRQIVPRDAVIQDNLLLFAEQLFPNVVAYMNIAQPTQTVFQGTIDLSSLGDYAGTGIAADNQYVYVTEESFVVRNDYGVSGNTKLFIAQYRQITDSQGQPPAVNFIQPSEASVVAGSTITVEVSAVDDLSVKDVEFLVNGQRIFVDTGAPFSVPLTIGFDATSVTITARASDWGGNVSEVDLLVPVKADTDRDGLSDDDEMSIHSTQPDNPDSDSDGLTDYQEVLLGSDPNNLDSDHDGLTDKEEVDQSTDPLNADTDGDGLSDSVEVTTDPLNPDTDGDGLSDSQEIERGTDPLLSDTDGDSLSDAQELSIYFTSPVIADSDSDGVSDGNEVLIGSDPNVVESDTDSDGIDNQTELTLGTNPGNPDTDGDTVLDGNEIIQRTNPLIPDTDGDGVNDGADIVNDWRYFLEGNQNNDEFGWSVNQAGDVNNDGINDIVVGAYADNRNGNHAGRVDVYSGADGSQLYTFFGDSAGDEFGWAVDGAGDVNGDGFADIIVGARAADSNGTDAGSVFIYSGKNGDVIYQLHGQGTHYLFGSSVSGLGDINNDGADDFIIGTRWDATGGHLAGSVAVISGADASVIYQFIGEAGDQLGYASNAAGDVNNDGVPDIIVGTPWNDESGTDAGKAIIYSGIDGTELYTFYGQSSEDYFGESVASAGDVNNDGFADVIIGASGDDNNANQSGSASVFSGVDGTRLYVFNGPAADDAFGFSVSGVGDVNQDGFDDVAAGTRWHDANGMSSGIVTVFSGNGGSILYTLNGYHANDALGASISGLGDIDGDGYADIVVGASGNGTVRVISSNADWDQDGVGTLNDPYPYVYMTATTDYDNDGVLDFVEIAGITDPLNSDTDNDGLPDGYELANDALNPLDHTDSAFDIDHDGLTALEEFVAGTQIATADTDGDGVLDGVEVNGGFDALDPSDNASLDIAVGLRAHLPFEGDLLDATGQGYHADGFGDVRYTGGVKGQSLSLETANEYIAIEQDLSVDDFTISMFVNLNRYAHMVGGASFPGNTLFSGASESTDNELLFMLGFFEPDYRGFHINSQGNTGENMPHVENILNQWVHVVVRRKEGVIYRYLNGESVDSVGLIQPNTINFEYIVLGAEQDCLRGCLQAAQNLYGRMDEVRIYDRAINAKEIQALFDEAITDTDGDGLSDEDEINLYQTRIDDPDSDNDQLSDFDEVARGTDPLNADSDGDLVNDGDEVNNGFDPLVASDNQVDITRNLLAYLPFENSTTDNAGNGYDAQTFGGVQFAEGVNGQAVYLPTSSDYLAIEKDMSLDDFSISVFVKLDQHNSTVYSSSVAGNVLFSAASSATDNELFAALGFAKPDDQGFHINSQNTTDAIIKHQYHIVDQWLHIAVIRKNGKIYRYFNGENLDPEGLAQPNTLPIEYLVLGNEQDCLRGCLQASQALYGYIDEFRIYDRAINLGELRALQQVATNDDDGDGLSHGEELVRMTNPLLADTDFDGLHDAEEVNLSSDPLISDANILLSDRSSSTTCAVRNNRVYCWGDSSAITQAVPTITTHITDIAVAANHACIIDAGSVRCWGQNPTYDGEVFDIINVPSFVREGNVKAISLNDTSACAITEERLVRCWGNSAAKFATQLQLTGLRHIVAANDYVMTLDDDGIQAWGDAAHQAPSLPSVRAPQFIHGDGHTYCMIDGDNIRCWGQSQSILNTIPMDIVNPFALSVYGNNACVIAQHGVTCWGDNAGGITQVPMLNTPRAISVGHQHACALHGDGMECWGQIDNSSIPSALNESTD